MRRRRRAVSGGGGDASRRGAGGRRRHPAAPQPVRKAAAGTAGRSGWNRPSTERRKEKLRLSCWRSGRNA